jgi:hypothetical protein
MKTLAAAQAWTADLPYSNNTKKPAARVLPGAERSAWMV